MLEDWSGLEDDGEPYTLTPSVLSLAIPAPTDGSRPRRAKWSELAPMPHAVTGALSFSLGGRFYVAGGSLDNGFDAKHSRQPHLQMLDLDSGQWSERAELPLLHFDGGAAHSGKFFAISLNRRAEPKTPGMRTLAERTTDRPPPTIYAYDPEADAWELQPPVPLPPPPEPRSLKVIGGPPDVVYRPEPLVLDHDAPLPLKRDHDEIAVTSCAAGLMVLGRGDGTAALLKVADGRIVSSSYLSNKEWSDEGISVFAQDHLLEGLNAASLDLSAHCRPLLRDWAERIEEEQNMLEETQEYVWEVEENGYAEEAHPNLDAARAWLTQAGIPLAAERHAKWLAERAAQEKREE